MLSKEIVVKTIGGIHVRVAVEIKKFIKDVDDRIFIKYKGDIVNCNNVLKTVALHVIQGDEITIVVDGINEKKILSDIERLLCY